MADDWAETTRTVSYEKAVEFHLNEQPGKLKPLVGSYNPASDVKVEITDRFSAAGKIRLLLVAGIFIQDNDSRADLVLVGDRLKRGAIERAVKSMEAEIGRELNYAVFETSDFLYRMEAYDKFIRDLLDYPHEKIINKLGI